MIVAKNDCDCCCDARGISRAFPVVWLERHSILFDFHGLFLWTFSESVDVFGGACNDWHRSSRIIRLIGIHFKYRYTCMYFVHITIKFLRISIHVIFESSCNQIFSAACSFHLACCWPHVRGSVRSPGWYVSTRSIYAVARPSDMIGCPGRF